MTLLDAARTGDRRALGRVVSAVEEDTAAGRKALAAAYKDGGGAWLTGVTGAPGAGKSTLVDLLIAELRRSQRVAVVAVDPSSPFTGGAILGDRVRMQRHTEDDGVYIRSMSNRGHLGGIAEATPRVIALLDGIGFDEIIVETVGVGQAEVEVASSADTVVVVVTAGWGDAVQAAKAGLIEVGDVFVVNKADRPGSEEAVKELVGALEIGAHRDWAPPVLETIASEGTGVAAVAAAIEEHRSHLVETGERERRRRDRARADLEAAMRSRLRRSDSGDVVPPDVLDLVVSRRLDPWAAADGVVA